jgi:hypothetical protein
MQKSIGSRAFEIAKKVENNLTQPIVISKSKSPNTKNVVDPK